MREDDTDFEMERTVTAEFESPATSPRSSLDLGSGPVQKKQERVAAHHERFSVTPGNNETLRAKIEKEFQEMRAAERAEREAAEEAKEKEAEILDLIDDTRHSPDVDLLGGRLTGDYAYQAVEDDKPLTPAKQPTQSAFDLIQWVPKIKKSILDKLPKGASTVGKFLVGVLAMGVATYLIVYALQANGAIDRIRGMTKETLALLSGTGGSVFTALIGGLVYDMATVRKREAAERMNKLIDQF